MADSAAVQSAPPAIPQRTGTDPYVGPTISILERVLAGYGPRDFSVRLWDGTEMPAAPGQPERFTLALRGPWALRRMLLPPNERVLGEAFLRGDFDLEGDLVAAMKLSDLFEHLAMDAFGLISLARLLRRLPRHEGDDLEANPRPLRAGLTGTPHSPERDRRAVTHHYDVGNGFFKLFLDRRMVYSCAYFPTGTEDLETAQLAKLDHTLRKLRLKPGERLLDIGCGWGALIIRAAEQFGVTALGITLSRPQAELANERIMEAGVAGRARAMVLDYRDLATQGPFDKLVSVGMVEHVGRAKLLEYFQAARAGLKPGGLFLNHGISSAARDASVSNPLDRLVFQRGAFVREYVFPDGELLPVSDANALAERAGFEVRDVESLREHYALTLRHWVARLEANREEALKYVDERTFRVWRLYMAGCSHAFTSARLGVHQTLLAKPDEGGRSAHPWSRADIYPSVRGKR